MNKLITLYDFQQDLSDDIDAAWKAGAQNVLAVSETGSGKTVIFSHKIQMFDGPSIVIAHRHELVTQISKALAKNGVRHKIIGQTSTIRACVDIHLKEIGKSYYDANAQCAVAGIDTLIRMNPNDRWFKQVGLWVLDEAHHLLAKNKWGKGIAMFPNARGLGVTATPCRSDGAGLGRHADGLFDIMLQAPGMREIIKRGFLSDYIIYAPKSDIDLSSVPISASGEFSQDPLRKAVHKSHIIGDVVEHYLKICPGKLGVTFCVDIESASAQAAAFRQQGVPAEVVSSQSSDLHRAQCIRRLERGDLKQLTNVDLFGEGFDLPAIECVSKARPTYSLALDRQQSGRAMRKAPGKTHGIIIDHVNNISRHSVPDKIIIWTLDRREKASRFVSVVTTRTCPECTAVYERVEGRTCPYCNYIVEYIGRKTPELVDGVLHELSPEELARLRGDIEAVKEPPKYPWSATQVIINSIDKRHRERLAALDELKNVMATWAVGMIDIARAQRLFYITFGIDVLSAQALGRKEAEELIERIKNYGYE